MDACLETFPLRTGTVRDELTSYFSWKHNVNLIFDPLYPAIRRLEALGEALPAESLAPPPTVALQKAVLRVAEMGSSAALEELFRVPIKADDFWSGRLDFGCPASARTTALIGTARAREILANVPLPLSLCIARRQANAVLLEGMREAFVKMGSVAPNQITRYMAEITTTEGTRGGRMVAAQQGYLHLYGNWCQRKLCHACPAAVFTARPGTSRPTRLVRSGRGRNG